MSNSIKLALIIAAVGLLGLILIFSAQSPNGSNATSASSDNPNGPNSSESAMPANTREIAPGILETAYGSRGALGNRYLARSDFDRFGLETPSRVKYISSLEMDYLSPLLSPDGIPSIDTPRYEGAFEADEWLNDEDIVLTVVHNGIARAYPTRILNWHEIVNDNFGDKPVAITFCPLCNSGMIFIRPEIDGRAVEFGTSGRIYKSDLVMYDRATLTLWSQIEGRPIVGPLVGEVGRLEQLPAGMTQWGIWREAHPNTDVLARPTTDLELGGYPPITSSETATQFNRDYNVNPYAAYLTDNRDTFGTPFSDRRLPAKADVVGIRFGEEHAKAYLKSSVQEEKLINDAVGDEAVLVLWDEASEDVLFYSREINGEVLEFALTNDELVDTQTNSLWSLSGEALEGPMADNNVSLEPIVGTTTFWFAWFNFHPHTELFALP